MDNLTKYVSNEDFTSQEEMDLAYNTLQSWLKDARFNGWLNCSLIGLCIAVVIFFFLTIANYYYVIFSDSFFMDSTTFLILCCGVLWVLYTVIGITYICMKYRADTFSVGTVTGSYQEGRHYFLWVQLANFIIPAPISKSLKHIYGQNSRIILCQMKNGKIILITLPPFQTDQPAT